MPRPSSPPGAKASTRCPSLAHTPHAPLQARAYPKPRHAQEPSTASSSKQSQATAKPSLSTHSKNALNAMTSLASKPKPLTQPRTPGQTPRPSPPRTAPASPVQWLAPPNKTRRAVPRVQNAPEPDSQSTKNTHTSGFKRQTPPNGSDPALQAQTLQPSMTPG